jgi:hypothetical protein
MVEQNKSRPAISAGENDIVPADFQVFQQGDGRRPIDGGLERCRDINAVNADSPAARRTRDLHQSITAAHHVRPAGQNMELGWILGPNSLDGKCNSQ